MDSKNDKEFYPFFLVHIKKSSDMRDMDLSKDHDKWIIYK